MDIMQISKTELYRLYPALVEWHQRSGSLEYYIVNLCRKAFELSAPRDALYHKGNNEWVTVRDLPKTHPLRADLQSVVLTSLMAEDCWKQ